MILHRFRRLVGVLALTLAPSLALAQSALQQPVTSGPKPDTVPAAFGKLYANDLFIQNLVAGRFNTLGAAAYLNVGAITGTVADGGALAAEIVRAQAAEQANATAIQTNATAISTETSRAQAAEALKAPIASPTFTGTPRVPTAAQGTAGTQAASLDFVATAVAAGAGGNQGVPPSRQILASGLATGGGDLTADRTITVPKAAQSDVAAGTDDAKALTSYSIAAALGAKAPLASPALVGTPTAPTAAVGTSTTQIATTAFTTSAVATETSRAQGVEATLAPLASPALTGSPTAPTPAAGDSSTKLATTAFAAGTKSLAASGYQKLPSGLILQWGTVTTSPGAPDAAITFPIAFPTAAIGLYPSIQGDTSAGYLFAAKYDALTTTGVNIRSRVAVNGGTVTTAAATITWFALGY